MAFDLVDLGWLQAPRGGSANGPTVAEKLVRLAQQTGQLEAYSEIKVGDDDGEEEPETEPLRLVAKEVLLPGKTAKKGGEG